MSDLWEADAEEMAAREKLVAQMGKSGLSRNEQETGISFFGDDKRFKLTSYVPVIVKKTLLHRNAKIEWVYARRTGKSNKRIDGTQAIRNGVSEGSVEGICATYPLGVLKVKGVPRKRQSVSKTINSSSESERANREF